MKTMYVACLLFVSSAVAGENQKIARGLQRSKTRAGGLSSLNLHDQLDADSNTQSSKAAPSPKRQIGFDIEQKPMPSPKANLVDSGALAQRAREFQALSSALSARAPSDNDLPTTQKQEKHNEKKKNPQVDNQQNSAPQKTEEEVNYNPCGYTPREIELFYAFAWAYPPRGPKDGLVPE